MTGVVAVYGAYQGLQSARRSRFILRISPVVLKFRPGQFDHINKLVGAGQKVDGQYFRYRMDIEMYNSGLGSGSVAKPRLIIEQRNRPPWTWHKHRPIVLEPETEHWEMERESPNVTSHTKVREGKSYRLGPGGSQDDELIYQVKEAADIQLCAKFHPELSYKAMFTDNQGRKRLVTITKFEEGEEYF